MDAATARTESKSVSDVLLGLELGVMGGVLMLAWFAVISPVLGHPWWLIPNLFASDFYTSREVYLGPGVITLVGAAIHIVSSGIAGCLNGVLTPGGRLSGLAVALASYLFGVLFLWKRMAPLALLPMVQPILWTAYFLFGSVLGWHNHRIRARRATLAG
jgi:hypothetical protein